VKRRVASFAILAALALPSGAVAHVVFSPPFVSGGVKTLVSLDVPNERSPHATIRVVASPPPGISIVSAKAPPGWLATVVNGSATWERGRISGSRTIGFPLWIDARVRAGTYSFRTEQRYDDGEIVRWQSDLQVLPATGAAAPKQHPLGAIVAGVAGGLVIALSLAAAHRFRRKPLQDR
jgi:uncharacterized protein YcnI